MCFPFSSPALLLLLFFLPPSLSHSALRWMAPQDPCYHADGRPRHCLPEFINAAYRVPVAVSGGASPETVLSLTDLHNLHNLSCWPGGGGGAAWAKDWTLTVPLGRRFEVTYISLQFCQAELPAFGSISILKSMDYGRSWRPLQYYSPRCLARFGVPPSLAVPSKSQESEPLCADPRPLHRHRGGLVLAFSMLDGRPSAPDFDYSPVLQDWVTATDIRLRRRRNHAAHLRDTTAAPPLPAPMTFALADLQVGGRCRCNGHGSRCRRDASGAALCQCEHHTAGPDCDSCQPFYCDRPWHRATPHQPHQCVPCQCNQHSTRCRFSMELYQLSGRHSGGVCLQCRHHTTGRHCHYCQDGYTRDHSRDISHRRACRPCSCHPVGALGRSCNQTTGQCRCRDGVTGLPCNRCAPGYQQSRSPLRPCVRIQEPVATTTAPPAYQLQYSTGEGCSSYCQPAEGRVRMNLRTYCLKDYVLKVQVQAMERSGPWWQFSVSVPSVFRSGSPRVRRGQRTLWVPERDLGCGCPPLQVGRTFLLIGSGAGPDESRLVADRSTLALLWRDHWTPKLRGFRGQERRGRCPAPAPSTTTYTPTRTSPAPTPSDSP
ncbi:netrin-1 [Amia ocellicauda]|uniref:netrin-1 n=1 Tax=Amia ocellicauda TaxID=2972642 RepID=UPI003464385B